MKYSIGSLKPQPGSSEREAASQRAFFLVRMTLPAAIGAALGFAAGRAGSAEDVTTAEVSSAIVSPQSSPSATRPRGKESLQRRLLAATRPSTDEDEREAEATYRQEQSKEVFDLMLEQLKLAAVGLRGNPEAVATHMYMYQVGLVEGLLHAAPELIPDLAKHIERSLCEPEASDAQLMVMAQITGQVPELATQGGFDCVFQNRKGEDLVLWRSMEAWRQSGLPRTPGIEKLERTAVHEQTRLRLRSEDDASELTAKSASVGASPSLEVEPLPITNLLK